MEKTEIIICGRCDGTGKITESGCTNYHQGHYDEWDEPCKECGGTGRRVQITSVTYRNLTPEELKLRERK